MPVHSHFLRISKHHAVQIRIHLAPQLADDSNSLMFASSAGDMSLGLDSVQMQRLLAAMSQFLPHALSQPASGKKTASSSGKYQANLYQNGVVKFIWCIMPNTTGQRLLSQRTTAIESQEALSQGHGHLSDEEELPDLDLDTAATSQSHRLRQTRFTTTSPELMRLDPRLVCIFPFEGKRLPASPLLEYSRELQTLHNFL
ncbi:hypothetical protein RI367_002463 [Sorochytrium milnesiophthora]